MQTDEMAELAVKMAAVMVRFDERCQSIEQRQAEFAQQLPVVLKGKVDALLQTLSGQAGQAVREGLEASIQECQRQLRDIAVGAESTLKALQATQASMASQRRSTWWAMAVVALLCVGSLVATYESLYGSYQARYDELKSQVTYLDAINHSDVVPCGNGQLCARVDDKAARFGDRKQYRVIEPRL